MDTFFQVLSYVLLSHHALLTPSVLGVFLGFPSASFTVKPDSFYALDWALSTYIPSPGQIIAVISCFSLLAFSPDSCVSLSPFLPVLAPTAVYSFCMYVWLSLS